MLEMKQIDKIGFLQTPSLRKLVRVHKFTVNPLPRIETNVKELKFLMFVIVIIIVIVKKLYSYII